MMYLSDLGILLFLGFVAAACAVMTYILWINKGDEIMKKFINSFLKNYGFLTILISAVAMIRGPFELDKNTIILYFFVSIILSFIEVSFYNQGDKK